MEIQDELTQADCADLPECICAGWVHTDEPRRGRLQWYEDLSWTDFYDPQILEAWADVYAAKA
jgi:hypothetical protein